MMMMMIKHWEYCVAYADDFFMGLVMMGVLVPSYNTIIKRREMLSWDIFYFEKEKEQ
jgi:hypothetical protein